MKDSIADVSEVHAAAIFRIQMGTSGVLCMHGVVGDDNSSGYRGTEALCSLCG
jgi:hypothetical protein